MAAAYALEVQLRPYVLNNGHPATLPCFIEVLSVSHLGCIGRIIKCYYDAPCPGFITQI